MNHQQLKTAEELTHGAGAKGLILFRGDEEIYRYEAPEGSNEERWHPDDLIDGSGWLMMATKTSRIEFIR